MIKAYLHFGGEFCNMPMGPMSTDLVDCIINNKTSQIVNQRRIKTKYAVKFNSIWRRVWRDDATAFMPICYIGSRCNPIATVQLL